MLAYGKKRLFQTNRIYLIPAFYLSFTPVILPPEYLLPSTFHSIEALVETAWNTKKYYCTAFIQIDF